MPHDQPGGHQGHAGFGRFAADLPEQTVPRVGIHHDHLHAGWQRHRGGIQQVYVTDTGDGYRTLLNRNSGRAVSIFGASTVDGARAAQWVQNSASDQFFTLEPVGAYYEIRSRADRPPTARRSSSGRTGTGSNSSGRWSR